MLGICAAALLASLAAMPGTALAEGSRSLYPSGYGGSGAGRANLNLDDGQTYLGIIPARTFLYVYAQAGEHILVGSRNRTGAGVGEIQVFDPQDFGTRGNETIPGSADFTCTSGTDGLIADRDAELAGPNSADGSQTVPNGYTPCAYQAPVSGIY
ncbi:MAG: hypothetical protein PHQ14_08825, partial [Chromatiales bacterium]|nr:hypothetical protein [Chromatiales bacterium]